MIASGEVRVGPQPTELRRVSSHTETAREFRRLGSGVRCSVRACYACGVTSSLARRGLLLSSGALLVSSWVTCVRAAESRVRLVPSAQCSPSLHSFERAVAGSVVGETDPELVVEVAFIDQPQGTEARVSIASELVEAERRVVARSCEEAIDASVAIAALALSSAPPDGRLRDGDAARAWRDPAVARESDSPMTSAAAANPTSVALGVTPRELDVAAPTTDPAAAHGVSLAAGVDHGVMRGTIGVIEVGAKARLPIGELRVTGRYGGGVEVEQMAAERYSRRAADFGAAAVSYCYGVGQHVSIHGCGGLELGVEHRLWAREEPTSSASGEEFLPSLRSTLGLVTSFGGSSVRPEAAVWGSLLSAGGSDEAEVLALRATIGAAMSF